MRSFITMLVLAIAIAIAAGFTQATDDKFISYIVDPQKQDLRLYWKNDSGEIFRSIKNLKDHIENKKKKLLFAMNGGMYQTDNSPLGLYIENFKKIKSLNTRSGSGNFYLKPNGVFYITKDNKAGVCQTGEYANKKDVKYATQSGPLLLVNGKIHSAFKDGSLKGTNGWKFWGYNCGHQLNNISNFQL
jgi:uncharacterized protein YigE (DUF2233 family)